MCVYHQMSTYKPLIINIYTFPKKNVVFPFQYNLFYFSFYFSFLKPWNWHVSLSFKPLSLYCWHLSSLLWTKKSISWNFNWTMISLLKNLFVLSLLFPQIVLSPNQRINLLMNYSIHSKLNIKYKTLFIIILFFIELIWIS